MEIQLSPITVRGYVAEEDKFRALQAVVDALDGTVYGSDQYTTHNYGMSRVKITIEVG